MANPNGILAFTVSADVSIKVMCRHTTLNRRGKTVWYGEDVDFTFGFLVVGHEHGVVTDFYAELSREGTCYFVNALPEGVASGQEGRRIVITEAPRACPDADEQEAFPGGPDAAVSSPASEAVFESDEVRESVPAWEPFDATKIKEEKSTLRVLAVYVKKTGDELQKICLGKPYMQGKTTGKEMVAHLAEVAEDVTNIIFKNSRINTAVEVLLEEIDDPDNLIGTATPLRVKSMLEGASLAIDSNDQNPRTLANRQFFKALSRLKQDRKAQVVCVLLGKKKAESSLGVAVSVPGSLRALLDSRDNLLGQCFISVLLADENMPAVALNRATFTHELGHVLGGEHPFVQLNTDKNDIKVLTGSKDYYWMKGYHLANPRYSTVMGYKRRLPYFSSADVRLSGRPALSLGEAISGVTPTDMARGLRVTARALAQAYRYARVGAHIDIGVMPRQEGRPVPGVVEQDIVGDQKLMLTAVPFAGRATFSHWRVDDAIVERGKPHIVINTGAPRTVRACFTELAEMHDVTFVADLPVEGFLVFYELFNDKGALTVYKHRVPGNGHVTLKLPHGTDVELESLPNVNKEINSHIFVYTLDRASFLSEAPRFRVTQNHTIGTRPVRLDFHVERGDLGYLVYEQYEDAAPFYTVKTYGNGNNTPWRVALHGVELARSEGDTLHFSKSLLVPELKPADVNHAVGVDITFGDGDTAQVVRKVLLDCDANVGKILLSREATLDVKAVAYSTFPSVSSMTVARGTRMYAQVLLSEEAQKAGYTVKSWNIGGATDRQVAFTVDNDMTLTVTFTR